ERRPCTTFSKPRAKPINLISPFGSPLATPAALVRAPARRQPSTRQLRWPSNTSKGGACWNQPWRTADSSPPEDTPVVAAEAAAPVPSAVLTRSPPMEMQPPVSPQQSECNPVGALQELVVQKGWRLPEYMVTQESGPAHRKEFTMTCRVERFIEIGSGTSKKLAKRNAAAKMLLRVHTVPLDARDGNEAEPDDDHFSIGVSSRLDGLRNRGPGCTWDSLRNSVGEKILSLRSCSVGSLGALGSACCSVLSELSEEQAFHVSYLDIEELSLSGLCQCL
ncbi:TAR (HIV) RNA binding protein 2, isoform CRA_b, partial [Mus musculus]